MNSSSHSFVPARASLSKPKGEHRQTMLIRRHTCDFIFNRLRVNVTQKRLSKPTVQVSTVGKSTAGYYSLAIDAITPQLWGNYSRRIAFVNYTHSSRSSDH